MLTGLRLIAGGAILCGVAVAADLPVLAAEPMRSDIMGMTSPGQIAGSQFDPRATHGLAEDEARFLEDLFALTEEAAELNTAVMRWLLSSESEGLHAADYLIRMDDVCQRIDQLNVPDRVESVRGYVAGSLRLQRSFVAEWFAAQRAGRPFTSQLTDEYAYHEGLHRSHRLLLKAFAELRALAPDADAPTHAAFRQHLHAVDLR